MDVIICNFKHENLISMHLYTLLSFYFFFSTENLIENCHADNLQKIPNTISCKTMLLQTILYLNASSLRHFRFETSQFITFTMKYL